MSWDHYEDAVETIGNKEYTKAILPKSIQLRSVSQWQSSIKKRDLSVDVLCCLDTTFLMLHATLSDTGTALLEL